MAQGSCETIFIRDPGGAKALFASGLSPSLLRLPRPAEARALLDRALRNWFPALVRTGYGAVPIAAALDLGGMLLGGRGGRLVASGATFGGRDESLGSRARRLRSLRAWMEASADFARLRRALARRATEGRCGRRDERVDEATRLDGPVLGILRRSALGRAATVRIPTIAVASEALQATIESPLEAILTARSPRVMEWLRPFIESWQVALDDRGPLWESVEARLEAEASIDSSSPLVSPDLRLLAEVLAGAGRTRPRREHEMLATAARSRVSEETGNKLALASGGYTGIRRLETTEDLGRLLASEWALPDETLDRRILDHEAAVLEVQGREEPAWRVLFSVVVFLDGRELAADPKSARSARALALWILDDLSRVLVPGGSRVEAEVAVIPPDASRCEHYRFPMECDGIAQPLYLRQEALFPAFFLRGSPGAGQPIARRPNGTAGNGDGSIRLDMELGPPELHVPPGLSLACHEGTANAMHVVAILPPTLEYGARYRIEVEEPFGPLDLSPSGGDTLSLIFPRLDRWILHTAGYPSPGGQVALDPTGLRGHVVSGILHRFPGAR